MRKWKQLKTKRKKVKRLLSIIGDFFKYRIWGDAKRGGIRGAWWWIKYHTTHRYHIINISGQDNYEYGWTDRDHAMYLACFKILVDFVEKESPKIGDETDTIESYKDSDRDWFDGEEEGIRACIARHKEIRALYSWWKVERKKEHEEVSKLMNEFDYEFSSKGVQCTGSFKARDEWHRRTDELEEKDEEMLMRLMKIRRSLWT